jgi:putative membrane protein
MAPRPRAQALHLDHGMKGGDVARGAAVGLLGGLLAAGAMSLAHRALSDLSPEPGGQGAAQPEDPTVKVASAATQLAGYHLTEEQKKRAGSLVHYAFGAVVGAFYGAAAEVVPVVTAAFALPFGAAVWLAAHVVAVPALGLAEPPTRQPLGKEGEELGLHLVYGSVTELVRRLLR